MSSIYRYCESYKQGGLEQLITDGYYGRRSMLTDEQLQQLRVELSENPRLTTKNVIAYVAQQFSLKYSVSGMTDLLHRLDFSYRKPKGFPPKADIVRQEQFVEDILTLRENLAKDEKIFFADASHPEMNAHPQSGHHLSAKILKTLVVLEGRRNKRAADIKADPSLAVDSNERDCALAQ